MLVVLENMSLQVNGNDQKSINNRRVLSLPHERRDALKGGLVGIRLSRILGHGVKDPDQAYERLASNGVNPHRITSKGSKLTPARCRETAGNVHFIAVFNLDTVGEDQALLNDFDIRLRAPDDLVNCGKRLSSLRRPFRLSVLVDETGELSRELIPDGVQQPDRVPGG